MDDSLAAKLDCKCNSGPLRMGAGVPKRYVTSKKKSFAKLSTAWGSASFAHDSRFVASASCFFSSWRCLCLRCRCTFHGIVDTCGGHSRPIRTLQHVECDALPFNSWTSSIRSSKDPDSRVDYSSNHHVCSSRLRDSEPIQHCWYSSTQLCRPT